MKILPKEAAMDIRSNPKTVMQRWRVNVSFDLASYSLENTMDEEKIKERIRLFIEATYYEFAKKSSLHFGQTSNLEVEEQK